MGLYKYVKETWKKQDPEFLQIQRKRLTEWRAQDTTVRIDRPTRIDRARSLGYRAKPGVLIIRQRVDRGGRKRPSIRAGRRSAHSYHRKNITKNYQQVAEERANRTYPNCEVVNSYFVGQDAICTWYEIIMIDRTNPSILADDIYRKLTTPQGRSYRGLTSAGRKGRGLRNKGFGAEKIRPSNRANSGHAN